MRLLIATSNSNKAREILDVLEGSPIRVATFKDFPSLPEVDEDQPTLEGNARKKAVEGAKATSLWTLADDTGLEVDALGGEPGVRSARYAGAGCDFAANIDKILKALKGVPGDRRKAVFRTVMALSSPDGRVVCEEGRLDGRIMESSNGENGFGYDPIFFVTAAGKTLGQMPLAEKNRISHRASALKRILPHIRRAMVCMLAVLLLSSAPAIAAKTDPELGQQTIWDEIMASQATRGLRSGVAHMELRQYEQAQKEFLRAVLSNPKDAVAHMMLGAAYYWLGKVDLALSEYRQSLELDPGNAQAMMLVGIAMAWKGDAKASYEAFKKAAELDPNRADIQMNLGSMEETLGMIPDALTHLRRAAALDPKHPLYQFQLGMIYRRLGRDADSIAALKQALKLMDTFEDAWLELGAAHERQGDRSAALHSFRRAVDLKARDSVARFRLGRLYLLNGERQRARDVFREAFHLTPEGESGGLALEVAYAGSKRPGPSSSGAVDRPEVKKPSNDPLDVFARNLERVPLDQGAVLEVDVAFVPKPQLVKAQASEAPSALKKALEKAVAPPTGSAKLVRRKFTLPAAPAEARSRQIRKVMEDLRQTMAQAPADSDARLGMNLTFTKLSRAAPAKADSGQDPKVFYEPRRVGNDLDLWVIGTGWMSLIEEVLPESDDWTGQPEDTDWWVATGLGFAAVGEGGKAMAAFDKAVQRDPKNELAWLGRGVASVMGGDEAAAVAAYQEVLRLNPKNKSAREGLKWLLTPAQGKK